jgi:hypothetical protein
MLPSKGLEKRNEGLWHSGTLSQILILFIFLVKAFPPLRDSRGPFDILIYNVLQYFSISDFELLHSFEKQIFLSLARSAQGAKVAKLKPFFSNRGTTIGEKKPC